MATISTLVSQTGALVEIKVPLDTGDALKRRIYGLPSFKEWLDDDLRKMETGRHQAADSPSEQVDYILYRWITGGHINYSRQFKDLMPQKDEVWEMKTVDVRIFGWIYRPLNFIAVFGDYADLYKSVRRSRSYEDARKKVIFERNRLLLDEPKFIGGSFDDLVSI
jgi:hypothetical protein